MLKLYSVNTTVRYSQKQDMVEKLYLITYMESCQDMLQKSSSVSGFILNTQDLCLLRNPFKRSSMSDVTVFGGGVRRFSDDGHEALLVKGLTMMKGSVKN